MTESGSGRATSTTSLPQSAAGSGTTTAQRPANGPAKTAATAESTGEVRKRRTRRARLRLTRIDPWSVMKTAFLLAIAFAIVTVVSVFIVWTVLGAAGVWESINATVADLLGSGAETDFDVEAYVGMDRVLGFTMLIAAVNTVLITAMATLGAFLYNMSAALLGGVEMTLTEGDR